MGLAAARALGAHFDAYPGIYLAVPEYTDRHRHGRLHHVGAAAVGLGAGVSRAGGGGAGEGGVGFHAAGGACEESASPSVHGVDNNSDVTNEISKTQEIIHRIQLLTIAWMVVEVCLSLWSAWKANSPALAAFGGDSAIELLSAIVVLWRFRGSASEHAERIAARMTGGLLFVLALFVVSVSVVSLRGYRVPQPSYLGMAVLVAALLVMPWLAARKRRLSVLTGSAALRADAVQSSMCAYLSCIALVGLSARALWHVEWADPLAALAITPLIFWEAREAFRGRACQCG